MKKTLGAMIFSCLMVVGLAGCGGDDDSTSSLISQTCEKMDECDTLSGMTVSQCKEIADALKGGTEPSSEEKAAVKACLEKSCEEFAVCSGSMAD